MYFQSWYYLQQCQHTNLLLSAAVQFLEKLVKLKSATADNEKSAFEVIVDGCASVSALNEAIKKKTLATYACDGEDFQLFGEERRE
ncbi:hypothetical protein CCR75_000522 [Bremia lactucae]|uniref:Uncharacterized protein n=1 Tax=Bremia lactucae TaxID=4779 RepID=A0A976IJY8_BRELC|nr:hypothetical protein CCR75_000522 [Bremia lactucae]